MKYVSFFLLFLMLSLNIKAQDSMAARIKLQLYPYMMSDIGTASGLMAQVKITPSFYIAAGVKLHHNKHDVPKINNEKLHHRFHANNTRERLGISIGAVKIVRLKEALFVPYLYYEFNIFHMGANYVIVPNDSNVNTNKTSTMIIGEYKDLYLLENNIGIGGTAKIVAQLFLNVRAGFCTNIISNLPKADYPDGYHINLGPQYAIGLQYNIK